MFWRTFPKHFISERLKAQAWESWCDHSRTGKPLSIFSPVEVTANMLWEAAVRLVRLDIYILSHTGR